MEETTSFNRMKHGFTEIINRQMGLSHPKSFSRHFSASEAVVEKIDLYGKLNGHEGCVNTIEFNSTGDILVSGSDDKHVMLWNWATKTRLLSYASGHLDNIFQARIMPFTNDKTIITSSADGQVRVGEIPQNGQVRTRRLGKHQGRVHNLDVEPGSPYIFYSCGEDGIVQHFDLRSNSATKLFRCSSFRDTNSHRQHLSLKLNAIVIDPRNPHYFSVGGSDAYARLYDIRRCHSDASNVSDSPVNVFCPRELIRSKNVQITGLSYSNTSELLVTYNDELIYLFQKSMGLGPFPLCLQSECSENLDEPQVYVGHRNSQTVKGVSFFGPKDEYVMSGSDCKHIFVWKKKGGKLVRVMVGDQHIVNHIASHPHMPFFASCGIDKNVKLWTPMATDSPALPKNLEKIMEFNRQSREDQAGMIICPGFIIDLLRLQRQRRYNAADDLDGEEEDGREDLFTELAIDSAFMEEDSTENSGDCKIS